MLFKYARKTQFLRILRGKMNQNVIFWVQKFFQNHAFQKKFFKIVLFKKIFLLQNLTSRNFFDSKSDAS